MLYELPDDILICIFVKYSEIFNTPRSLSLLVASCNQFLILFNENNMHMKLVWLIRASYLYPIVDYCKHEFTTSRLYGYHRSMDICTIINNDRYRLNRFVLLLRFLDTVSCHGEPIAIHLYSTHLLNTFKSLNITPVNTTYFFTNIIGINPIDHRIEMMCYDYYPRLIIRLCIERYNGRYEPRLYIKSTSIWIEKKWDMALLDFCKICLNQYDILYSRYSFMRMLPSCSFDKITRNSPLLFHKQINITNAGNYEV